MKIQVRSIVGREMTSRTDGKKLRHYLEAHWNDVSKFTIDFENLEIASVSFIDEAFGRLLDVYTLEQMVERLEFVNMDKEDRKLLNVIIISRKKEKERLSRAG